MPPKKKTQETVQTKLNFKPISSTQKSLFTMESTTTSISKKPSQISVLNNQNSNIPNNSLSSTSNTSLKTLQPHKQQQQKQEQQSSQIGGKPLIRKLDGTTQNTVDDGVFSTRDLVTSISESNSSSKSSLATAAIITTTTTSTATEASLASNQGSKLTATTVNGVTNDLTTGSNPISESAKSRQVDSTNTSLVDLESDSDDELLQMPNQQTKSSSTLESSSPSLEPSTPLPAKPLSLLEQMATPRGTKPLPRTADLLGFKGPNTFSRSSSRPLLVYSSSSISDDGFTSGSSLDSKMLRSSESQEPEMTPPLSQSSVDEQNLSISSKVKNYSQKRSSDFSSYSVSASKKRILPSSITGYQPLSSVQPGVKTTTVPSYGRASSFDRSVTSENTKTSSPTQPINEDLTYNGVTRDGMVLSDEQRYVLQQVVLYHRNVFFTGSAGTGKSVLLRELIIQLRNKYNNRNKRDSYESSGGDAVAVTASTGIAACNIGGCTLHSFAGVGLGQEALPVLQGKMRRNPNIIKRWVDTKVLIVDEVSMVDSVFMDKLEALARIVRKNDSPWGGIQVVLTGDFFQLPPVNKNGNVKFCFEGEFWARTIHETIQLKQVFRQKDQTFANMLNEMRLGQMSPVTMQRFRTLTRDLPVGNGPRATELFPLRNQVDEANTRMLNSLPGKTYTFIAKDRGPQKEKMEQNCLAPTTLHLKVNSQVMLLRNQGGGVGGLVNGSLGILVGFVNRPAENDIPGGTGLGKNSLNMPGEELPLVKFILEGGQTREMVVGREEWKLELPNGELQGARIQIPLGLAWSLSIHKSQGQTLQKVRVDLGKVFEKGQAYVALSRATSLEGLQVLNFDPRKVMVHPKVTEFYANLRVYKRQNNDDEGAKQQGVPY